MASHTTPAILLHTRLHGESGAIATFLTEQTGLVKTYVRITKKNKADWQPGNIGQLTWRRRVESQLGNGTWDVSDPIASRCFTNARALHTLNYVTDVLPQTLPEEQAYEAFYARTVAFMATLMEDNLAERLALWELKLLTTVGYGLSLSPAEAVPCPNNSPLTYVSPNTGRAVPADVGKPYQDKLLRLPHLFGGPVQEASLEAPFKLTGFFLERALHGKPLPSRRRILEHLI